MQFLFDFFKAPTVYNQGISKAELYFQNNLTDLNAGLVRTISLINELNSSLSTFCYDVQLAGDSQVNPGRSFNKHFLGHLNGKKLQEAERFDEHNPEESTTNYEKIIRNLESISNLTESADKLSHAFGKLPKGVEKFTKGLGLVGNMSSGLKGIAELVSAGEKSGSITDGIAGVSDMLGGAAAAGAVAGPEGILFAVAGMLTEIEGHAIYNAVSEAFHDRTTNVEEFKSGIAQTVWDDERKKDFKALMGYNKVRDLKGLNDTELELDSGYMVADRIRRVDKALEDIKVSFPDFDLRAGKGNFPTVKPQTHFREDIRDAFFPHHNKVQSEAVQLAAKAAEIRQTAMIESMGGKVDYKKMNKQITELYKGSQTKQSTKEPAWRLPSDDEWDSFVRSEIGLPPLPNARKTAIKTNDADRRYGGPGSNSTQGGRVININLNKPMIENFIINTKDSNEDIKNFRRKVEEVLIEILNSANVI